MKCHNFLCGIYDICQLTAENDLFIQKDFARRCSARKAFNRIDKHVEKTGPHMEELDYVWQEEKDKARKV